MIIDVSMGDVVPEIPRVERPKEMLSVSQLADGRTLVRINSSSLSIIQECLRKSHYSLNERWLGKNESPATLFGSAIHKALEVFYLADPSQRALPKFEDAELLISANPQLSKDNLVLRAIAAFVERAEPLRELPDTDKRSIPNGIWTLWHYFKAYIDDPYVAFVDESGRPFVERSFSFTLHEDETLKIDYFGTVDLVVKHQKSGDLYVCDHKTSSVVGADFYNRLKPNHQYTGYLMGVRESFGLPIDSFLVNCIQVKARPLTSRGTPPHYPRQVTTRDQADYDEFRSVIVANVHNYLRGRQTGVWPLGQVNACAQYGGCQYLAVCAAPSTLRENILQSKFNRYTKEN